MWPLPWVTHGNLIHHYNWSYSREIFTLVGCSVLYSHIYRVHYIWEDLHLVTCSRKFFPNRKAQLLWHDNAILCSQSLYHMIFVNCIMCLCTLTTIYFICYITALIAWSNLSIMYYNYDCCTTIASYSFL